MKTISRGMGCWSGQEGSWLEKVLGKTGWNAQFQPLMPRLYEDCSSEAFCEYQSEQAEL